MLITVVLASVVFIALALLAAALLAVRRQLQSLQLQHQEFAQKFSALEQQQQHQQNEVLAMGQRILEADKMVRRFSARIDAIEMAGPSKTQYGQLEALLNKAQESEADASAAETELLALLRQQQRR